jgi:hypothetical protein
MSCAAAKVTAPGNATEAANTTAVQVSFVIKSSQIFYFKFRSAAANAAMHALFAVHHRVRISTIQIEIIGHLQCPRPLPLV